jgi:hypothetical protein
VVAEVRERLTVSIQELQTFHVEDLILRSWRFRNIIRLRSQKGLKLWRTEMIERA